MEIQQSQQPTKQERRELQRQERWFEQQRRTKIKMLKLAGIWLAIVLLVGALIWGLGRFSSQSSAEQTVSSINAISDQIKGNKEARIILIEYSDFQCPACGAYHPIVKQLLQEFGEEIVFVYRHFPLRQIHQNAESAARVTEAAGKQEKFWEMYDMIFGNQKKWSNQIDPLETFIKYAESLGLNASQFKNDVALKEIKDKVNSDYKSGVRFGVNATPTFFLNGKKLQNPRNYEEFKSLIQSAIFQQSL